MDSTRSRLPPPPKHPQSLSTASSPIPRNSDPSPILDHSHPPAIPPRQNYSSSLDESASSRLALDASGSHHLRSSTPPKHPSLSGCSSNSNPAILVPEDHSIPPPIQTRPADSQISIASSSASHSEPQSDISEFSHVGDAPLHTHIESSSVEETPESTFSSTPQSAFEKPLSERELRDLYDDEDIDRFLRLFSAHVNEVKLQDSPAARIQFSAEGQGILVGNLPEHDPIEDGEWTSVNNLASSPLSSQPSKHHDLYLSERIAVNYVLPLLPLQSPPVPPFTTGRLKLTIQRLFLALEPGYRFFISHLLHLATWQDKPLSLKYCTGFWVLWFYNLLLPFFLLYLLYTLLYRKLHPYPTLNELREHRQSIDNAREFGDILQMRLESYPAFGVKEAWRIFRVYNKSRKLAKIQEKSSKKGTEETELVDLQDAAVLEDQDECKQESDIKAIALEGMTELTDAMERLKNIFSWRRPVASYAFGLVLGAMFLLTLLLPAKYLAKLVYFVGGVVYWHITPVILAISPQDRRRLVSPLYQVPTEAEYAMELISRRVASGQEIKPLKRRKPAKTPISRGEPGGSFEAFTVEKNPDTKSKGKLKKGVAMFTALANEGAKMVTREQFLHNAFAPDAAKEAGGETHTYPAQYGRTPGVITLTPTTLFFTILMSSSAKVVISLEQITGIKKGFSKAVSIQLLDGEGEQRVERFLWVYERDDLFARLVGSGRRKWLKV